MYLKTAGSQTCWAGTRSDGSEKACKRWHCICCGCRDLNLFQRLAGTFNGRREKSYACPWWYRTVYIIVDRRLGLITGILVSLHRHLGISERGEGGWWSIASFNLWSVSWNPAFKELNVKDLYRMTRVKARRWEERWVGSTKGAQAEPTGRGCGDRTPGCHAFLGPLGGRAGSVPCLAHTHTLWKQAFPYKQSRMFLLAPIMPVYPFKNEGARGKGNYQRS